MQKIIAGALAALCVAPAAMADVTITGSIRTGLEYVQQSGPGVSANLTRVQDQGSRIAFVGEDKWDDGLSTIWQVQNKLHIGGTSGDTWGNRNTFIGVKGGFGNVTFGRNEDALYTASAYYVPELDGTYNYSEDAWGNGELLFRLEERNANIASFESSKFGNFGVNASVGNLGLNNGSTNPLQYAGTAYYDDGTFTAGATYKRDKDTSSLLSSTLSTTTYKAGDYLEDYAVGGGATWNGFTVNALWERVASSFGGSNTHQDDAAILLGYKTGPWSFHTSYLYMADVKGDTPISASGAKQFNLAAYYKLSKATRVFASYTRLDNDANASFEQSTGVPNGTAGDKANIFSLGLRTNF